VGSVAVLVVVLAGCGYSRTPVPRADFPVRPTAYLGEGFPRVGIDLLIPRNWSESISELPLAATISSGPAVIALWHYSRSARPPSDRAALAAARRALISAARVRDPGLTLIRTRLTRIARSPAVVLDAFERINGRPRRVRSLHIYISGAEVVIDEYAPVAEFHYVDRYVFSPLNHSIKLRRRRST
jgi:hypothetical protein